MYLDIVRFKIYYIDEIYIINESYLQSDIINGTVLTITRGTAIKCLKEITY